MNIAIIGANGQAGSLILQEAVSRGHDVTAIVRNASSIADPSVNVLEKDLFNLTPSDVSGFDAVVNTFKAAEGQEHLYVDAGRKLIEVFRQTPNTRLIVVGGAGSLFVDEKNETKLMDTPEFPAFVYPTASNAGKQLDELRLSESVNWTYASPAAFFDPNGPRTGAYKLGKDHVIANSQGQSYVSYADYAVAIVDEIENARHANERFTVVGEAQ